MGRRFEGRQQKQRMSKRTSNLTEHKIDSISSESDLRKYLKIYVKHTIAIEALVSDVLHRLEQCSKSAETTAQTLQEQSQQIAKNVIICKEKDQSLAKTQKKLNSLVEKEQKVINQLTMVCQQMGVKKLDSAYDMLKEVSKVFQTCQAKTEEYKDKCEELKRKSKVGQLEGQLKQVRAEVRKAGEEKKTLEQTLVEAVQKRADAVKRAEKAELRLAEIEEQHKEQELRVVSPCFFFTCSIHCSETRSHIFSVRTKVIFSLLYAIP